MGDLFLPWYGYLGVVCTALYFAKWYFDPVGGHPSLSAPEACSWVVSGQLRSIPTVGGFSLPLLSYFAARRWLRDSREILQEGYDKVRQR